MDENEHKHEQVKGGERLLLKHILHLLFLLPVALILTFTSYNYYYLSAFVLPILTHTFQKKYIFLLCTTILTFITNNFGFKEKHDQKLVLDAPLIPLTLVDQGDMQIATEDQYEEEFNDHRESDDQVNINQEVGGEVEQESKNEGESVHDEEVEQASSCSNSCVDMDTEELNKKIEEFIRKMRQDLRLESKEQQLITV